MAKEEIKVILFDLGNVLLDFDFKTAVERISRFCEKHPKDIFSFFLDSELTNSFEEGRVSPEEFYLQVKNALDLKLGYDSFVAIWNEVFFLSPKNRAVYHIANLLKHKYRTVLLSNTNLLHYEYIKKEFPVLNVFETAFLSFKIGATKPKKLIYQKVIDGLGVLPENIFYTDDRKELIKSARELGMQSFVFVSAEQLTKDLLSCGVSIFSHEKSTLPKTFL